MQCIGELREKLGGNNMKKVLAIVLAAMVVVGMLAACGNKAQATTAAPAETTVAETTAAPATTAPAASEEAPPEMPEGEAPEGEVPADVPQGGTSVNSAHGQQTPDAAGYYLYIQDWLKAEQAVNAQVTDANIEEFLACIEKGDYSSFPADMLYSGMLATGVAMTIDEFIKAGGVY